MFLQGSVEGFSLSKEISWEWQANLGISRNHRMYLSAPKSQSFQLGTSKSLLRTNLALPELGMQLGDPTHLQPSPSVTQNHLELIFLPPAMKKFSKRCYRPPQFPQKNVLWLPEGSSFILEVNHSEVIHPAVFLWVIAVRQGCPTPLRLSELANAIFICLCSCCTADTDNTSIVFSASTNRELAHFNTPWIGSNLAARLDFS